MRKICFLFFMLASWSLTSQITLFEEEEERELSKHEIGFSSNGFVVAPFGFPSLSYHYYRKESNVLHFGLSGAYNGSFYQAVRFDFFNEQRRYLPKREKWFLSHGLAMNLGYSRFNYAQISSVQENFSGISAGVGYDVGIGYQIGKRLNITARTGPRLTYLHTNSTRDINSVKVNFPFQLSLNYRF